MLNSCSALDVTAIGRASLHVKRLLEQWTLHISKSKRKTRNLQTVLPRKKILHVFFLKGSSSNAKNARHNFVEETIGVQKVSIHPRDDVCCTFNCISIQRYRNVGERVQAATVTAPCNNDNRCCRVVQQEIDACSSS